MSLNGGNMIKCAKCSSLDVVKNGFVGGKQRYKCGKCGYQFTTEIPRGKPISLKLLVHGLYECGFSMRKTAQIAGVTVQTVSRWIKKWHVIYKEEQGNNEILYEVNRKNINACLGLSENENCVMISNKLPSGYKVNIIIQPPD